MPEVETLPKSQLWSPRAPAAPKAVINYINGGPSDEEYDSKRKRQKLLRAASVRERINSIRPGITGGGPRPIDGTIIFPPVDPTRILQPHRDALIMSLEIGDFDVRRILVDPAARPILCKHRSLATWGTVSQASKTLGESYPDSTGRQLLPWETLYCRSKLAQSLSTYNFRCQLAARQCYQIAREAGTTRRMHPSLSPAMRGPIAIIGSGGQRSPGSGSLASNPNFGRRYSPYEYQFPPDTRRDPEHTERPQTKP
ncbi:hypothetical protein CK203_113309 [Vitis vinifera]|uniref:Uncharacterized protein n=1 Tax=Vitis vinifera TaxID=29760 RepID=A0A438FGK1_VITVI|nr:hypothetical protein CK203_113309 [Vitis vinifera]